MTTTQSQHWRDRTTLSVAEAAVVLGIGRSTMYEAVRSGVVPTVKIGKRYLIPVDALHRFLAV